MGLPKRKWAGTSVQGCDNPECRPFGGKQTVCSLNEAERIFFSKSMQRSAFGGTVEELRRAGVTHACMHCGTWYWGMTGEHRARREAIHGTA